MQGKLRLAATMFLSGGIVSPVEVSVNSGVAQPVPFSPEK